jgi:hypothetical protein
MILVTYKKIKGKKNAVFLYFSSLHAITLVEQPGDPQIICTVHPRLWSFFDFEVMFRYCLRKNICYSNSHSTTFSRGLRVLTHASHTGGIVP